MSDMEEVLTRAIRALHMTDEDRLNPAGKIAYAQAAALIAIYRRLELLNHRLGDTNERLDRLADGSRE